MAKGILGEKLGMLQLWTDDGQVVGVTAIKAGPCPVVQVKTPEKDGYSSIQIGFGEASAKRLNKSEAGHQKKLAEASGKFCEKLAEVRDFPEAKTVGDVLTCEIFTAGEIVSVQGVSKGKGFQGAVKRHGFGGGRATHGSTFHRNTGSIGAGTDPSNVWKGKKMPGRMGSDTTTSIRLQIVKIMPEENVLLVKGSVPGAIGSSVYIFNN